MPYANGFAESGNENTDLENTRILNDLRSIEMVSNFSIYANNVLIALID